ncbi:MAG: 2-amino-4-hydroxy-6-hydroxymethyldihydropteridine diphosphokinase [bacterium (Candidatus Stahlbacteria) CG23_combo_of_CG06-09_8_20_14_all_34_7]|nr:MAG: 2-amino-4-hydroxy-6-hydroxymethyldihydropteridine diphosphokinase [bacterium (Candidatus Stahlbacteria) CG23_combo_of_CG06-09_8_20_14_all_34_7]
MTINNRIILCIGSNLKDKYKNIKNAINLLRKNGIEITGSSNLYETEPVDFENQESFYNISLLGTTNLSPEEVLITAKNIESLMGRQKSPKNGPRLIDIDILLYNDIIVRKKQLHIPHKRIKERFFVLRMLKDIDENIVIPGTALHVKDLYERVNKDKYVTKLPDKLLKGII